MHRINALLGRGTSGEQSTEFVHSPLNKHTMDYHPIRILHMQPSENYYSPIHCSLEHLNILSSPRFKALSYAWGDPNITLSIFVDAKRYQVTANCHAALLRLRETGETVLWIDAICINQKDDDEKSIQIRMMADVFRGASEVVVWLGRSEAERQPDDQEKEGLAVELIDELSSFRTTYVFEHYVEIAKNDGNLKQKWAALDWLCHHSWFKRLWTLQETCIPRHNRVLLQYKIFSDKKFQKAACSAFKFERRNHIAWKEFKQREGVVLTGDFHFAIGFSEFRRQIWYEKNDNNEEAQVSSIRRLMTQTLPFESFDARDRVFGVMALMESGAARSIKLDYQSSLLQLYREATRAMLEQDRSLGVICTAGIGRIPDLVDNCDSWPSWVVDWRVKKTRPRAHPLKYNIYQCSRQVTKPIYHFSEADARFKLAGVRVDDVSGCMNHRLLMSEKGLQSWTTKGDGLKFWRRQFTDYASGCDPYDAWVHTITGNHSRDTDDRILLSEEMFLKFKQLSLPNSAAKKPDGNDPTGEEKFKYRQARRRTLELRKFFVSKSGYMGVGPRRQHDLRFPRLQRPASHSKRRGPLPLSWRMFRTGTHGRRSMGRQKC